MRRALGAGLGGTLLEEALTAAERALLGPAPYDTAHLARQLAGRAHVRLDRRQARAAGLAMRFSYGPAWGLPAALVRDRLPPLPAGLALAAMLLGLELTALPLTGATAPPWRWAKRHLLAEVLNVTAFGLLSTWIAGRLRRPERAASAFDAVEARPAIPA